MQTQVKTPQDIFNQPQRLLVPLFQRPYVWTQDGQWQPLWEDVSGLANQLLETGKATPHFLGAIVIQQLPNEIGSMTARIVIDGQQRLTTLQILLDAVHAQVELTGHQDFAQRVFALVENASYYCTHPEDKYKVWPTNKDRLAFNEVMSAPLPIDYAHLVHTNSRITKAHQYFSGQIRTWLDQEDSRRRCEVLVNVVTALLMIVVIDLQQDEDAQEIFETLNARGTPLTAADLIKNFVFQRLNATSEESEGAYHSYWEDFETPFWEKEISAGRLFHSRSSLFLNQWLIAQTAKDVPAREVFGHFKRFVINEGTPIDSLLPRIKRSADLYKDLILSSENFSKELNRVQLFIYRTSTMETEVIKPLILWLLDAELSKIPEAQLRKALDSIESWLIRRNCVQATTKGYNKFLVDMLGELKKGDRDKAGDFIERFLKSQVSVTTYWPGDESVRKSLSTMQVYTVLRRSRLRMILEAIEDHRRGFDEVKPLHEQRVIRGTCTIEHIMPQEWSTNWPGAESEEQKEERKKLIHTLGNLTLITKSLNSKVSNGPWAGAGGKREALKKYSSMHITHDVIEAGLETWDESKILARTERMIDDILSIWAVPAGHKGIPVGDSVRLKRRVEIADLVAANMLQHGQILYARPKASRGKTCTIGMDCRLHVENRAPLYTPSGAAKAVSGTKSEEGWLFWAINGSDGTPIYEIRQNYLDSLDESLFAEEENAD